MTHAFDDTHCACDEQIKKYGNNVECCYCNNHPCKEDKERVGKEPRRTCNQCHEEFEYHAEMDTGKVPSVCVNPSCPSFALLQIPAELMPTPSESGY